MSRLLKMLEQFDDNVTVGQVISKLREDEISAKQKETEEIDKVKKDFKDVYLKRVYDCDLFGETLKVYHIEEIIGHTMYEDYTLGYFVSGSKISFSLRDINFRKFKENTSDTFSEEELRGMTKITEKDFEDYIFKYKEIKSKLAKIIE